MRGRKQTVPGHPVANDMRDWCVIGLVAAVSALVVWLPVLSRLHF